MDAEKDNQDGQVEDEQVVEGEETKKLSKNQKKKARLARKKEEQKQAENAEEPKQAKVEEEKNQTEKKQEEAGKQTEEKKQNTKKGEEKQKKKKKGKPTAAALLAKKKYEEQMKFEEEQERKRKEFEEEQERLRKQEQERLRKQQEEKDRIAKERQEKKKEQKSKGLFMNKKQKEKMEKARQQLEALKREEAAEKQEKTEEDLEEERKRQEKLKAKQERRNKADAREQFMKKGGKYRSPVCCILGHVDTGKTTLLDKIRRTNVQEGEAGGITQQIGATFFPQQKLKEEVEKCKEVLPIQVQVPGLLIIDTPGHESFSNLRSRGSSLCDIAILVIDIQHGLEKQTLESMQLLEKGKTPFVVALNKIDRSYNWQCFADESSYTSLKNQKPESFHDYQTKLEKVILQLNQKGYNAALYWKNENPDEYISLIPTSGITGEGIPDLLSMIVHDSLKKDKIRKRIKINPDKFKCTVMEVKMIEGYGTTIDCLLVDGALKKDDQIVLLGFDGPIVTKVKALLTPHPMKEMRVKDQYLHHSMLHAANGVKIAANNLDQAVAGSPLFVVQNEEELEEAIIECQDEITNLEKKFKLELTGVGVAASTLGSLEALLEYLRGEKIPVSHISVGPVSREDVIKAMKSILTEIPEKRKQEYACLLVFDIKVLPDAMKYAEENGIKIITANIIYHLTDEFTKHVADIKQRRREKEGKQAVFPCVLKQVATFRKSDPIVLGVDVQYGVLKIGTPLAIYEEKQKGVEKVLKLGVVESIEHNHKKVQEARKKTGSVAVAIGGDPSIMAGRHFDQKDKLASVVSRRSIDCLKEHFRDEVTKDEWSLVVELKKYFGVI